ncbi:Outer membrane protein TolC [Hymenobacter gelipurpurascens]|uniref:Outer membrane protein TolC n=1 Tax=Hymenobacter gelipurpurascens TaxID=89968 RepID=A0A212THR5_9BACT|nr:TolC family protein [Hymenobacter gelipurpurascens]SNC65420.1 Outer membrane protein TolC [Hymenobacter gelipurpurascens]
MNGSRWLRLGVVAFLLSVTYPLAAQTASHPAEPLTLEQAWALATAHNKEVLMQRRQVALSAELVKDRQNEHLPHVTTSGSYAYLGGLIAYEPYAGLHNPEQKAVPPSPHAYHVGLEADWEVYTGGRINNQIATQTVNEGLETERLALTASDVRLRVATAYLDVQRNREYQALTANNVKESERRLTQIRSLFKNGVVLRSDLLRAELQLSRQQLLLTEIGNTLTLTNQRLNLLLGTSEDQVNQLAPVNPTPAVLDTTYADYLGQAQANAPELRVAGLQTRLSELRLQATQVSKRPQVGLFTGYAYTYPNRLVFPNVSQIYGVGEVGVRVSYNITARWLDRHAEKAAEIGIERQRIGQERVLDDKRQEVKTAYVRYQETQERLRIAEQSIGQAAENYRIVSHTYFNQLALLTDLLDADNQLLQARFDLVTAQTLAGTYYYQLQKAIGHL